MWQVSLSPYEQVPKKRRTLGCILQLTLVVQMKSLPMIQKLEQQRFIITETLNIPNDHQFIVGKPDVDEAALSEFLKELIS